MKYLLIIFLIGIALYYAMKWQSSGSKTDKKQKAPKQGDPYTNPSGSSRSTQSQRDTGPYQSKSTSQGMGGNGNYAKWIGGGLGWAFGGPIGGLLGFMLGSMFSGVKVGSMSEGSTQQGDFNISLLVLTAAVMKADGTVKRSELEFVKRFFVSNFGQAQAVQYVKLLSELLKQELDVQGVSRQIGQYMDYSSKMILLQYLFGIAQADSKNHPSEIDLIQTIAAYMGISPKDYDSIKAMFVKDTGTAYQVLEVSADATDEEIKKAYREAAKKHHPDRVAHLGEDVKKAAEEKFTKLNAAYEAIKEERGLV